LTKQRNRTGGNRIFDPASLQAPKLHPRSLVCSLAIPLVLFSPPWRLVGRSFQIRRRAAKQATVFTNEYEEGNPDSRVQTVTSVAAPFAPSDLKSVDAGWFYLGPPAHLRCAGMAPDQ